MELKNEIKRKVECFCDDFASSSILFEKAKANSLNIGVVTRYFAALEVLFKKNYEILESLVENKSLSEELRQYFLIKLKEEKNHDDWAKNDQVKIHKIRHEKVSKPQEDVFRFIKFLDEYSKKNPEYFLVYIYVAEYSVTILGPKWMSFLEQLFEMKKSDATSLSNHITLDENHHGEALEMIEKIKLEASKKDLLSFLDKLLREYYGFFDGFAFDRSI